jgi:hypothetical protein
VSPPDGHAKIIKISSNLLSAFFFLLSRQNCNVHNAGLVVATAYGPRSVQGLANEGGIIVAGAGTVQVGKSTNGYKIQCSHEDGTAY